MLSLLDDPLAFATAAALLVFLALSALDGVYLHLYKLRLHARPESYREHLWHTVRAALFPVILTTVVAPTGGALLWFGVGVVALDEAVELLDMWSERGSRSGLGGLGSGEYTLHVAITSARAAMLALAFAGRPAEAWYLGGTDVAGGPGLAALAEALLPGAIAVAALHVWLAVRYAPLVRAAAAAR